LTNGSSWGVSAISTAEWRGAKLSDILAATIGITVDHIDDSGAINGFQHVQFISEDGMEASIPLIKALDRRGDVLLAYEMNGEDVPPQHGWPVRVIVPGHVGVRNVKWIKSIRLAAEEARGPWQRGMAYKVQ
jgi:sulfite oxidase